VLDARGVLDGAALARHDATNRVALGACSTLGALVLDGAALAALVLARRDASIAPRVFRPEYAGRVSRPFTA
jgi:hypothetical protein